MITYGYDNFGYVVSFSSIEEVLEDQQVNFGCISFGEDTTFNQGE